MRVMTLHCGSNKKLRDAEITAVGRCVYTLILYTRLASAVAVCIAIRGRYTPLAWLANRNRGLILDNATLLTLTLTHPTNPTYG